MPTAEPIDYAAELDRIAARAMHPNNPGQFVGAMDGMAIKEAAALIRRQAEVLARLEWSRREYDYTGGYLRVCPECNQRKNRGHAPDCPLKAALDGR